MREFLDFAVPYGGKTRIASVPEDEVDSFLEKAPGAERLITFENEEGRTAIVPESKLEDFYSKGGDRLTRIATIGGNEGKASGSLPWSELQRMRAGERGDKYFRAAADDDDYWKNRYNTAEQVAGAAINSVRDTAETVGARAGAFARQSLENPKGVNATIMRGIMGDARADAAEEYRAGEAFFDALREQRNGKKWKIPEVVEGEGREESLAEAQRVEEEIQAFEKALDWSEGRKRMEAAEKWARKHPGQDPIHVAEEQWRREIGDKMKRAEKSETENDELIAPVADAVVKAVVATGNHDDWAARAARSGELDADRSLFEDMLFQTAQNAGNLGAAAIGAVLDKASAELSKGGIGGAAAGLLVKGAATLVKSGMNANEAKGFIEEGLQYGIPPEQLLGAAEVYGHLSGLIENWEQAGNIKVGGGKKIGDVLSRVPGAGDLLEKIPGRLNKAIAGQAWGMLKQGIAEGGEEVAQNGLQLAMMATSLNRWMDAKKLDKAEWMERNADAPFKIGEDGKIAVDWRKAKGELAEAAKGGAEVALGMGAGGMAATGVRVARRNSATNAVYGKLGASASGSLQAKEEALRIWAGMKGNSQLDIEEAERKALDADREAGGRDARNESTLGNLRELNRAAYGDIGKARREAIANALGDSPDAAKVEIGEDGVARVGANGVTVEYDTEAGGWIVRDREGNVVAGADGGIQTVEDANAEAMGANVEQAVREVEGRAKEKAFELAQKATGVKGELYRTAFDLSDQDFEDAMKQAMEQTDGDEEAALARVGRLNGIRLKDGTVAVFSDNLRDNEDLYDVLWHEGNVHNGLLRAIADEDQRKALFLEIGNNVRRMTPDEIAERIADVKDGTRPWESHDDYFTTMFNFYREYDKGGKIGADDFETLEECLAYMSQGHALSTEPKANAIERGASKLRGWLRGIGLNVPFTEADYRLYLDHWANARQSGNAKPAAEAKPQPKPQPAAEAKPQPKPQPKPKRKAETKPLAAPAPESGTSLKDFLSARGNPVGADDGIFADGDVDDAIATIERDGGGEKGRLLEELGAFLGEEGEHAGKVREAITRTTKETTDAKEQETGADGARTDSHPGGRGEEAGTGGAAQGAEGEEAAAAQSATEGAEPVGEAPDRAALEGERAALEAKVKRLEDVSGKWAERRDNGGEDNRKGFENQVRAGDAIARARARIAEIDKTLDGMAAQPEETAVQPENILSGDEVRKSMPGYNRLDWRTHVDKSGFVGPKLEERFQRLLKERKGKGNGSVVFLAGGNGAGKSTVASGLGAADFIIDSTLGNKDVARRQMKAIIANGQKPVVAFVYQTPEQALENIGGRVRNGGHIVSPLSFADSHTRSIENMLALAEEFGDKIDIRVYDNSAAGAPRITLEQLKAKGIPDHGQIRKQADEYLTKLRDGGLAGQGGEVGAEQGGGQGQKGEAGQVAPAAAPAKPAKKRETYAARKARKAEIEAENKRLSERASKFGEATQNDAWETIVRCGLSGGGILPVPPNFPKIWRAQKAWKRAMDPRTYGKTFIDAHGNKVEASTRNEPFRNKADYGIGGEWDWFWGEIDGQDLDGDRIRFLFGRYIQWANKPKGFRPNSVAVNKLGGVETEDVSEFLANLGLASGEIGSYDDAREYTFDRAYKAVADALDAWEKFCNNPDSFRSEREIEEAEFEEEMANGRAIEIEAALDADEKEIRNALFFVEGPNGHWRAFGRDRLSELKYGDLVSWDGETAKYPFLSYDRENGILRISDGTYDGAREFEITEEYAREITKHESEEANGEQPEEQPAEAAETQSGDAEADRRQAEARPDDVRAGDAQGEPGRDEGRGAAAAEEAGGSSAKEDNFALESVSNLQIEEEKRRRAQREEIEKRQNAPLTGNAGEVNQTLLDLGGEEGEDLFNRTERNGQPAQAAAQPEPTPAQPKTSIPFRVGDIRLDSGVICKGVIPVRGQSFTDADIAAINEAIAPHGLTASIGEAGKRTLVVKRQTKGGKGGYIAEFNKAEAEATAALDALNPAAAQAPAPAATKNAPKAGQKPHATPRTISFAKLRNEEQREAAASALEKIDQLVADVEDGKITSGNATGRAKSIVAGYQKSVDAMLRRGASGVERGNLTEFDEAVKNVSNAKPVKAASSGAVRADVTASAAMARGKAAAGAREKLARILAQETIEDMQDAATETGVWQTGGEMNTERAESIDSLYNDIEALWAAKHPDAARAFFNEQIADDVIDEAEKARYRSMIDMLDANAYGEAEQRAAESRIAARIARKDSGAVRFSRGDIAAPVEAAEGRDANDGNARLALTFKDFSDALESRLDEGAASGDYRFRNDTDREQILRGARRFFNEFSQRQIPLSDGRIVYFAPSSLTLERTGGDIAKAWAIYAIHAATSGGAKVEGKDYSERLLNPAKIAMLDDIEHIIKEENVHEQIREGRPEEDGVIFYGVSNGRNVSIVTRLDKFGNIDADLTEVTANTPRKMKFPPFTPLTEAIKRVAIHQGAGSSPATDANSIAQNGEAVKEVAIYKNAEGTSAPANKSGEASRIFVDKRLSKFLGKVKGNSGDGDVRFSRSDIARWGERGSVEANNDIIREIRARAEADEPRGIMDGGLSRGDELIRRFQDLAIPVRRIEEAFDIAPEDGVYRDLDLAYGKEEHALNDLWNNTVTPILAALDEQGLEWDDLSQYLEAKFAPVRNRLIEERTDGMRLDGSGMDDLRANAVLRNFKAAGKTAALDAVAQMVWKMNRDALQARVDAGLVSREDADRMLARGENYVPMQSDPDMIEDSFGPTGAAGGIGAKEYNAALGRSTLAGDPLALSIMAAQRSRARAIKNEVRQKLARLVQAHPELGSVLNGQPVKRTLRDGRVAYTIDRSFREKRRGEGDAGGNAGVVQFKEDGQLKYVVLNGKLGAEAAAAFTRSDEWTPEGWVWEKFSAFNRWLARTRTSLSPTFLVRNGVIDNKQVVFNMAADGFGAREIKEFEASLPSAWRSVYNYLKDGSLEGDLGGDMEEFVKAGGLIKGAESQGYADTMEKLAKSIARAKAHGLKKAALNAATRMELLNGTIETATRLAVFRAARQGGLSPEAAAAYARDITVNFNRKGNATSVLNTIYQFMNASVQDIERSLRSMTGRNGRNTGRAGRPRLALAGLFLSGMASAILSNLIGGDDDDEEEDYKNLPEYTKQSTQFLKLGKVYLRSGIRGPMALVNYMGVKAGELMLGVTSAKDAAFDLAEFAFETALDPLPNAKLMRKDGGGIDVADTLLNMFMPTAFQPLVQMGTNRSFTGDPLYGRKFNDYLPDSGTGHAYTADAYTWMARTLNQLTGGDEFSKGVIDFAPETYQMIVETVLGGMGNDFFRTLGTVGNIANGELPVDRTPFLRDVVRSVPDNSRRYYEAKARQARWETSAKGYRADHDWAKVHEFEAGHPSAKQGVSARLREKAKLIKNLRKQEARLTGPAAERTRQRRTKLQGEYIKLLGD